MQRLAHVTGVVALVYVAYLALIFVTQRRVIYPGWGLAGSGITASDRVEVVRLAAGGAEVEAAFLVPAGVERGEPFPALIFAHGNGELIDDWVSALRPLSEAGLGVLLVEYPGYGRSSGRPTQASTTAAMVAGYDWLIARGAGAGRITGYGRSLGGGPICGLSLERPLAALVLQSTFTSLRPMAASMLAPPFLLRDLYDNLSAVRQFEGPVLVLHSRRDEVIGFAHGERLAAAASTDAVEIPWGHNDMNPDEVFAVVLRWLSDKGLLTLL